MDPLRVREIMANLVANAIRHTPAGGRVHLTVTTEVDEALIDVSDTGEGFRPSSSDACSTAMSATPIGWLRTRARDRREPGGRARRQVTAESSGVPGEGARFRVRLPIRG